MINATFTQHPGEPDGQILLHGHQSGFMSHCQPLVVLEDICEARAMPLCQRAARAPGAHQGGVEFLPEPYLETRKVENMRVGKRGRR